MFALGSGAERKRPPYGVPLHSRRKISLSLILHEQFPQYKRSYLACSFAYAWTRRFSSSVNVGLTDQFAGVAAGVAAVGAARMTIRGCGTAGERRNGERSPTAKKLSRLRGIVAGDALLLHLAHWSVAPSRRLVNTPG